MKIIFNKVTWYSKILAVIVFIFVLPSLTFYIGMRYQEVKGVNLANSESIKKEVSISELSDNSDTINLQCELNKKLKIRSMEVSNSPGPGSIYIPKNQTLITLQLGNGKESGFLNELTYSSKSATYANEDKSLVLEVKNNTATVKENGVPTYDNCILSE